MHDDRAILLVPFDASQRRQAEQFEARLAALVPDVTVMAVPGMRGTTTWLLIQGAPAAEPEPEPEPEPWPAQTGPLLRATADGHVIRRPAA